MAITFTFKIFLPFLVFLPVFIDLRQEIRENMLHSSYKCANLSHSMPNLIAEISVPVSGNKDVAAFFKEKAAFFLDRTSETSELFGNTSDKKARLWGGAGGGWKKS